MAAAASSWPLGRGFDRWYGFHGGETHQFVPTLYHDNHSVRRRARPPTATTSARTSPTARSSSSATCAPSTPTSRSSCYFATGACHSPHHAPPEWIERYRGQFDDGWDAWRERDLRPPARRRACCPPGTELSPRPHVGAGVGRRSRPTTSAVAARFMECFAAFLSHTDAQIGRLLDVPRASSATLDNTLVVARLRQRRERRGRRRPARSTTSRLVERRSRPGRRELRARIDEIGGPTAHNNYPWGWTMAGNTPFRRWKREVHEGGVADPCIVRWPRGIAGARRDPPPVRARDRRAARRCSSSSASTRPPRIDGVAQSPDRRHELRVRCSPTPTRPSATTTQYFEMLGSPRRSTTTAGRR